VPHPEHISSCQPFNEIQLNWHFASGKGFEPHSGRTLIATDELFRSPNQQSLFRSGGPFTSAEQVGVIVSPRLLEHLGYPEGIQPGTDLKIQTPNSGETKEIKIVGVTHTPLPLGHLFIMNHHAYMRLLTEDPNVTGSTIDTGPIGPTWPDTPAELRDRSKSKYHEFGWDGFGMERVDGTRYYKFRLAKARAMPTSHWRFFLKNLYEEIMKDYPPHPPFVQVHVVGAQDKEPPSLPPPEWVGIYVEDLDALRPTVRAVIDDDWLANEAGLAQMEEISRSFKTAMLVLWGLMVLFLIAAGVSFYSVHSLRAQQKAAQIGMMRALGMSDRQLTELFLLEADMLWRRGTLLGMVGASLVLGLLAFFSLQRSEVLAVFRDWGSLYVVVFLLISWLCSRFTASFSTRRLRSQSPSSSLGLTS
jgi:hypothetical protein